MDALSPINISHKIIYNNNTSNKSMKYLPNITTDEMKTDIIDTSIYNNINSLYIDNKNISTMDQLEELANEICILENHNNFLENN